MSSKLSRSGFLKGYGLSGNSTVGGLSYTDRVGVRYLDMIFLTWETSFRTI